MNNELNINNICKRTDWVVNKNFIYEGDILKITFLNYIDNTTYIHNFEHKFFTEFCLYVIVQFATKYHVVLKVLNNFGFNMPTSYDPFCKGNIIELDDERLLDTEAFIVRNAYMNYIKENQKERNIEL